MTAAGLPWAQIAAVAGGSALGALIRWRVGVWLPTPALGFPLGTLAVNCIGGLLIGLAMPLLGQPSDEWLRLLLVTGFLGGLTTFSSFSGESLSLLQRGEWALAGLHAAAHVAGSLACAALGFRCGRLLFG